MRVLPNGRGPVRSARAVARYSPSTHFCSLYLDCTARSVTALTKPRYAARLANTVVQATVSHATDEYIDFLPLSWYELARRTWREVVDDDVLGLAAQLSYYFFLALFPAIVFLLALASFFPLSNITDVRSRREAPSCRRRFSGSFPGQMRRHAGNENGGLLTFASRARCGAVREAQTDRSRAVVRASGFSGCHLRKRLSGPIWERSRQRVFYLQRGPSQRAMARVRARVRDLTPRARCHADLRTIIADLNPVLRGWGQFFRTGNAANHFTDIDEYVERRLRGLLLQRAGSRLTAGRAAAWTRPFFETLGLIRLRGTIRSVVHATT